MRERDFALVASVGHVRAGLVTFRIFNAGPSAHEFIVDRTDESDDALPLQKDGLAVAEDSSKLRQVAALAEVRLGATRDLTVSLAPGHYVLFCNHEGHYRGGMYAAIQVVA